MAARGGRCWFVLDSKSFHIFVEVGGGEVGTIVVKGAPRLEAARRHPLAPRLKAGDTPSRRRRLGTQGATRSPDSPPTRYALLLLFLSGCRGLG